jgi:hypothetical protein
VVAVSSVVEEDGHVSACVVAGGCLVWAEVVHVLVCVAQESPGISG